MMFRKLTTATIAVAAGLGWAATSQANEFITIGTGGVTGVYYPTGGAICRLVNQDRREHGIRCSVESTGGSAYNANTIRAGELEFGVAQSDVHSNAFNGLAQFEAAGPDANLRSVFSVHPEPFTVVARADAGISTFDDLQGKRVNIGNPGSGQRATMEVVMEAKGWTVDDFAVATEFRSGEQAAALCDNQIDAMIFSVGHPSGSIQEASTSCDAVLVEVSGPEIDQLVADNSFYGYATIPGGMYRGTDSDVNTFGVGATVITSEAVSADAVYVLVKAVFDNFDTFTGLHPAFANLSEERMISAGLTAPLHDGAIRYYRERGWME